jgi:hypothetical protein
LALFPFSTAATEPRKVKPWMRFVWDGGKTAGARMNFIRLLPWSGMGKSRSARPAKKDKPF